jgi:hypothetical protein
MITTTNRSFTPENVGLTDWYNRIKFSSIPTYKKPAHPSNKNNMKSTFLFTSFLYPTRVESVVPCHKEGNRVEKRRSKKFKIKVDDPICHALAITGDRIPLKLEKKVNIQYIKNVS